MTHRFRTILSAVCLVTSVAAAQAQAIHARPTARIHGKIDRQVRRTLPGTHPEILERATIGSRLASSTQLNNLVLVLEPSQEQKTALRALLDAQQDKNSPNYHKWLTPDTFATDFGVAPSDIAQVSAYLADSGLKVENVAHSGRFITFSGTVGQVEAAFGTQMHRVSVDGEAHISNVGDITVPAAIAPVVRGLARANDFKPRSTAQDAWKKVSVPVSPQGTVAPNFGGTPTGTHYIGAGDIAKIYNAKPLTDAGFTGKGVSVSVVAQSNIQLADVQSYRSLFGLPKNDPNIVIVGNDPGENADDLEAFLDAELAGAVAPDASINFVVSSPGLVSGGIDSAALYIVDNNLGDIVTMSYGGCEKSNGASYTGFWNLLWEIAAAQGQTVFVSSGDSGASGCASSSATSAGSNGYGVNALGSSAYNVAVGGTMFVDWGPAQYWGSNTGIPYATALGYIPEAALNQSRLTSTLLNDASTAYTTSTGVFAGGGGISIFTPRPAWQTGSGINPTADPAATSGTGLPPGTVAGAITTAPRRLVPDVSFISAYGHDGTLMCGEGSCYSTPTGGLGTAIIIGGTSVAAPAMASVQALINSYNGGSRQGNANYYYYALAAQQYSASTTSCQSTIGSASNTTVTLPASTCNFNDVTAGNITVPTSASGAAGVGFAAGVGYDAATGLGSPNIANLAHNWSSVNFKSTTTTLSLTPTTSAHGTSVNATIQVTSNTGTPTGDIGIVAQGITNGAYAQAFSLTGGSVNGTLEALPGGTYNVYAHYDGDGTYAASDSAPVQVTVTKESSTASTLVHYLTSAGNWEGGAGVTSYNYGAGQIHFTTTVAAASGAANGVPVGTVTYTVTRGSTPMPSLTAKLDGSAIAELVSGPNYGSFDINANYPTLPAGTYTVVATYSGDNSFNTSSTTTNFTVNTIAPTYSFTTSSAQIASGATATLNVTITTPAAAYPATGTITFTDTTTNTVLGTATLSNGRAVFTTTGITTSGAHSISAAYSGDNNYRAGTATPNVTVTVGSLTAPSLTLTASATPTVGATVTLTATLSPKPASATAVYFYDGGVLLGNSNAAVASGVATLNVTTFTGGTHSLTASFTGNTTQKTTTGSLSLAVAQRATTITIGGGAKAAYGQAIYLNGTISRTGITGTSAALTAPVVTLGGLVNFYEGSASGALLGSATPVYAPGQYNGDFVGTVNLSNLSVGSHTIVAVYAGDGNYATSTSTSMPVTITKADQTISFTGLPSTLTLPGSYSYTLAATATSGLPVSYSVSGPATLTGNTLTITGAGTVIVTATQAGNGNYNAATSVSQTIVVSKSNQTITFTGLPASATYGGGAGPYTLSGTASSGLPVSYTVSGPATLSGSTLTITGTGTVVVTASQAGNGNYNAATPVSQSIVIGSLAVSATQSIAKVGGNYVVTVTVKNTGTGAAQNVTVSNVTIGSTTGTPASVSLGTLAAGASTSASFTVAGTAGNSGAQAALKITGSYTGGTFGGSYRVVLP